MDRPQRDEFAFRVDNALKMTLGRLANARQVSMVNNATEEEITMKYRMWLGQHSFVGTQTGTSIHILQLASRSNE